MRPTAHLSFNKALLLTAAIGALWTGFGELLRPALVNLDPVLKKLILSIGPSGVVLVSVILIEVFTDNGGFKAAIRRLGFKFGNLVQYRIAAVGSLPIIASFAVAFWALKAPSATAPNLILLVIGFAFSQGLVEEAVFRGFIFRRLRNTRSFWRAACLSGLLFGGIHLANFVHGFTPEIAASVAISVVFGFLLAIPLAALFEVGANSIAASGILHVIIDSINWFPNAADTTAATVTYLTGVFFSGVVVTLLARKAKRP